MSFGHIAPLYAAEEIQEGTREIFRSDLAVMLWEEHMYQSPLYKAEIDTMLGVLLSHTVFTQATLEEAMRYISLEALTRFFSTQAYGGHPTLTEDPRCHFRVKKTASEVLLANLLRNLWPLASPYPIPLRHVERTDSFMLIAEEIQELLPSVVFYNREQSVAVRTVLENLVTELRRVPKIPGDENTYDHLCCNVVVEKLPALYASVQRPLR
jgi:hypothetical protein